MTGRCDVAESTTMIAYGLSQRETYPTEIPRD